MSIAAQKFAERVVIQPESSGCIVLGLSCILQSSSVLKCQVVSSLQSVNGFSCSPFIIITTRAVSSRNIMDVIARIP